MPGKQPSGQPSARSEAARTSAAALTSNRSSGKSSLWMHELDPGRGSTREKKSFQRHAVPSSFLFFSPSHIVCSASSPGSARACGPAPRRASLASTAGGDAVVRPCWRARFDLSYLLNLTLTTCKSTFPQTTRPEQERTTRPYQRTSASPLGALPDTPYTVSLDRPWRWLAGGPPRQQCSSVQGPGAAPAARAH